MIGHSSCVEKAETRMATIMSTRAGAAPATFVPTSFRPRTHRVIITRAEKEASTPAASASTSNQQSSPSTGYRREFRSLGSKVIETDGDLDQPPPVGEDPWEGEKFEALGSLLEKWFLPLLLVLGLVCGGIAAGSYNQDATTYIKPAAGPEETVQVVPADKLKQ